MNKLIPALALLAISSAANADDNSCQYQDCRVGDKVITYVEPNDMYYACPTRELADYISLVFTFTEMSIHLNGHIPNISDKTGEPEFLDGADGKPNKARLILEEFRHAAHVRTFDQAMGQCVEGVSGLSVRVMNNPGSAKAIWVALDGSAATAWIPSNHLIKR